MARQFRSAAAFKAALESNLRNSASEGRVPFATLQLKFVMERLLARLFHEPNPPWLLKGGFAMDLRFRPRARTTKDVDLSIPLAADDEPDFAAAIRDRLQQHLDVDLGDWLRYRIGEPRSELTNAPGGGARFPCEALLLGKIYARFHIDVGCGDPLLGEPEQLAGDDLLSFAGIAPATAWAIPKAQQFAEKIHAYTFPWSGRFNTRSKDLVDLVLLLERSLPDASSIREAMAATFAARGTHSPPRVLPPPPEQWANEFRAMASDAGLSVTDHHAAFARLAGFWDEHRLGTGPFPENTI